MQVTLDVPERIASVFDRFPDTPINELPEKFGLTHYESRAWWFALKKGKISYIDESYQDRVKKYFDEKSGKIIVNSLTICTLEEALAVADTDLSKYKVDRHVINSWGVTVKGDNGPIYRTNYQVKVWLVSKTPAEKSFDSILEEIKKKSPSVELIHKKKKTKHQNRELEIDIYDPHLGLHCFKGGSDSSQSMESCEELIIAVVEDLIDQSSHYGPFKRVIWPFGHDYLHLDNVFGTTTAGTTQPEADAWHEVYLRGERLGIQIINRLKEVAPVEVIIVPGNHDRHSAFTIGRLFNAWFNNDKNVSVLCSPDPYKFHAYGVNLIGFEHGHSITPIRLAALMANETRKKGWADAKYCEWHLGDQHRKGSAKPSTFEEQGVSVEYLPGLTSPNEWHRLKSFNHQKRCGVGFIWDKYRGPIAKIQTHIDNETNWIMGEEK